MSKAQYFKTVSVDEALPKKPIQPKGGQTVGAKLSYGKDFIVLIDNEITIAQFYYDEKKWFVEWNLRHRPLKEHDVTAIVTHWLQPITVPDAISEEEIMLETESFFPGDKPEQHNSQSCFMAGAFWANKRLSLVISEIQEQNQVLIEEKDELSDPDRIQSFADDMRYEGYKQAESIIADKDAQIECLRKVLSNSKDALIELNGEEKQWAVQLIENINNILNPTT